MPSPDIIDKLRQQAADPARVFLHGPPPVSYARLWHQTGRLANTLAALGVVAGDRVLLQAEKTAEALSLYLACLRLGAVFLPVNPAYTLSETRHFLSDARPALIIADAPRATDLRGQGQVIALQGDPEALVERASLANPDFTDPSPGPDDLAAILYTSGTTGRSKGVMLSRENLASNAVALTNLWRFTAKDILLHVLPVFHTHGLFVATNCVLYSGASMIFHQRFDAGAVVSDLPRATVMMGVPTFYSRLLADPRLTKASVAHIRLFTSGSAPLSPQTFAEWDQRTAKPILERYGMTETNMITSNPYSGARIAGTVGMPLSGVSLRITDAGGVLAQGQIGAIEVKGPNVFKGYWAMPEQTAREFTPDGWFVTGDLGAIDAAGYLSIQGRAKDLVISGGLNVYPAEVEAAIDAQPGIAASAVIGVPHPDFGEAVVACVVASSGAVPDPETLRRALRTHLAAFKIPKEIILLQDLPRNAMGKVQKAELRRQYAGLFPAAR